MLKFFRIHPKTVLHIGAGNGEDRELYFELGINKLIWVEANFEKYTKILHRYPLDYILNFYATDNQLKEKQNKKKFDSNKPTFNSADLNTPRQSLDQVFFDLVFDLPLLLVIDTDGAEVDILLGANKTLKKVSYLVIEQHFYWDNGEWHKEISKICVDNGFRRTLSRPSYTNDYEDVLWTRLSVSQIILIKILDLVFLCLKQVKHIFKEKHLSTTYFDCKICNALS